MRRSAVRRTENRQLVTTIELLSPANMYAGPDRKAYLSILEDLHSKGCQIASYRTDSQPQGRETPAFTHQGFEGNQSNNDVYRFYFSREVEFSGIPSGCFYQFDSVPGVSVRYNPRLRSAIASRSRLQAKPHNFTDKYRYPRWWYPIETFTITLRPSAKWNAGQQRFQLTEPRWGTRSGSSRPRVAHFVSNPGL